MCDPSWTRSACSTPPSSPMSSLDVVDVVALGAPRANVRLSVHGRARPSRARTALRSRARSPTPSPPCRSQQRPRTTRATVVRTRSSALTTPFRHRNRMTIVTAAARVRSSRRPCRPVRHTDAAGAGGRPTCDAAGRGAARFFGRTQIHAILVPSVVGSRRNSDPWGRAECEV
jgi:hypothetical protein